MPPRRTTGDTRAAKTQIRTADQTARLPRDDQSKEAPGGGLTAPLAGREFRLAENVGIMPIMEWAASGDTDTSNTDGLRAVFYVLMDTVHEDDWADFRRHAREEKLEAPALIAFVNAALEALSGRPTEDASGS